MSRVSTAHVSVVRLPPTGERIIAMDWEFCTSDACWRPSGGASYTKKGLHAFPCCSTHFFIRDHFLSRKKMVVNFLLYIVRIPTKFPAVLFYSYFWNDWSSEMQTAGSLSRIPSDILTKTYILMIFPSILTALWYSYQDLRPSDVPTRVHPFPIATIRYSLPYILQVMLILPPRGYWTERSF